MCELCGRDAVLTDHHLIPKMKRKQNKYKKEYSPDRIAMLCGPCHDQIHALFSEKELADHYNTIEKLRASAAVHKFVKWIKNRPTDLKIKAKKRKWNA